MAAPEAVAERAREAGPGLLAAGDGSIRFREELEAAGIGVAADESRCTTWCGPCTSAGWRRRCRASRPRRSSPTTSEHPTPRSREPRTSEIRRLTYADLPQVIAIERRAFPTPWSLAMFVLELSKPSGICLAAMIDERLVGYLVCSRYDTVWHVMNVAVDARLRRRGDRHAR